MPNLSGVMNFATFPVFFASSRLCPVIKVQGPSVFLFWLGLLSPLTHAVASIRFALFSPFNVVPFVINCGAPVCFLGTVVGYDPAQGLQCRNAAA